MEGLTGAATTGWGAVTVYASNVSFSRAASTFAKGLSAHAGHLMRVEVAMHELAGHMHGGAANVCSGSALLMQAVLCICMCCADAGCAAGGTHNRW